MPRSIKLFFIGVALSLAFSAQAVAAPWVNLKLTYDFSQHNYSAEAVYINVNSKQLDNLTMPPIIMDNMTLVPAREVFEALGAVVDWKKETEEIYIACGDNIAIIKIGSKSANCNGETKEMALAPKIINNKTMVPVRFVSEFLGFQVDWVDEERTIYITGQAQQITTTTAAATVTTEQTTEQTTEAGTEVEIPNPFFNGGDISAATETAAETTTYGETSSSSSVMASAAVDVSKLNSGSLSTIEFNDNFYYDRNMRNLVFSADCISGGASCVTQYEDKANKRQYFSFKANNAESINSGKCQVDDENISTIEIYNNNGEIVICFNEKTEVEYKVYEEEGSVFFKPFT